MATKKQETLPEEEILQEAVLQTDVNPELEEMPRPEDSSPDTEPSQTDPEDFQEGVPSEEFRDSEPKDEPVSQTDMEMDDGKPPSELKEKLSSQTDADSSGDVMQHVLRKPAAIIRWRLHCFLCRNNDLELTVVNDCERTGGIVKIQPAVLPSCKDFFCVPAFSPALPLGQVH